MKRRTRTTTPIPAKTTPASGLLSKKLLAAAAGVGEVVGEVVETKFVTVSVLESARLVPVLRGVIDVDVAKIVDDSADDEEDDINDELDVVVLVAEALADVLVPVGKLDVACDPMVFRMLLAPSAALLTWLPKVATALLTSPRTVLTAPPRPSMVSPAAFPRPPTRPPALLMSVVVELSPVSEPSPSPAPSPESKAMAKVPKRT